MTSSLSNHHTSSSSSLTNQISSSPLLNPLLNLDQIQKLQWSPLLGNGVYDPLAAQLIQNYLIMQELQKFETRRIALQSHYLKMQNIRWPRKGNFTTTATTTSKHQHNNNHHNNGGGGGSGASGTGGE